MSGAFAHISVVNFALETSSLRELDMPRVAKKYLSRNQNFVELGCVSPDYPYLKVGDHPQNEWADKMHYDEVGTFLKAAIEQVRNLDEEDQERAFAWLSGYLAHVISDITIHPVVERRVGCYEENKEEHRICEMNQDAYIWPKLGLGEIGYADKVQDNIGSCTDPDDPEQLDMLIQNIWTSCLEEVHPEKAEIDPPDINAWHNGFQFVVGTVEEGYRLFPMARHVAASKGLVYPDSEEIDTSYTEALDTPHGEEDYDAIFERAVANLKIYWCYLANAIFEDGDVEMFRNWNLDNGQDEDGILTAWEE